MTLEIHNWTSYLVIPLPLSEANRYALEKDKNWRNWNLRLGKKKTEETENQAFFIPSLQDHLMPFPTEKEDRLKRLSFRLEKCDRIHMTNETDKEKVTISWFDLFIWDHWAIGLIKLEKLGNEPFDGNEMRLFSHQASILLERFSGDKTDFWQTSNGQSTSLLDWLMAGPFAQLTQQTKDELKNGHWTGASMPSIDLISSTVSDWDNDDLREMIVDICCGRLPSDKHKPSKTVEEQIEKGKFEEWDDWCLYERRGKALIIQNHNTNGPIKGSLERFYAPLFAFIQFQKVRLTDFQDSFSKALQDKSNSQNFRGSFQAFRQQYLDFRISTYPTGNALYQHLRKQEQIVDAQKDIEEEIKNADDLERLELDRYINSIITYITVCIAITLPASIFGSLFGIPEDLLGSYWKENFWPALGVSTLGFLLFLFILVNILKKR